MSIQDTSAQDRTIRPKSIKRALNWIIPAVLIVVAVGVYYAVYMRAWFSADRSFERSRVRIAQVVRGDLTRELAVEGRIVASSYPTLYAPADGRVRLKVRAGDRVKEGDLLAVIESPELNNRVLQEESQLAAINAELTRQQIAAQTMKLTNQQDTDLKQLRLETNKRELARSKQLFDQGLVNRSDYDAAVDAVSISELEYKHAVEKAALDLSTQSLETQNRANQKERQQLVLDEAKRKVAELSIQSPVNGMIGSISVDPRDAVVANQEVLTVIDLTAFEIEIQIPEFYADAVEVGHPAEIRYENKIFGGLVSLVSPEVNRSTVSGRVVFDEAGPEGLKQNQRVSTRIILNTQKDVLKVRRGPFLEAGGGRTSYLVHEDLARKVAIETGAVSLTEVEMVSGVSEGDFLVISDPGVFQGSETVYLYE